MNIEPELLAAERLQPARRGRPLKDAALICASTAYACRFDVPMAVALLRPKRAYDATTDIAVGGSHAGVRLVIAGPSDTKAVAQLRARSNYCAWIPDEGCRAKNRLSRSICACATRGRLRR